MPAKRMCANCNKPTDEEYDLGCAGTICFFSLLTTLCLAGIIPGLLFLLVAHLVLTKRCRECKVAFG